MKNGEAWGMSQLKPVDNESADEALITMKKIGTTKEKVYIFCYSQKGDQRARFYHLKAPTTA